MATCTLVAPDCEFGSDSALNLSAVSRLATERDGGDVDRSHNVGQGLTARQYMYATAALPVSLPTEIDDANSDLPLYKHRRHYVGQIKRKEQG